MSIFILPPGLDVLEKRLRGRNTDSAESLRKRIEKAEYEMSFASGFDCRVVNDDLDTAVSEVGKIIGDFIGGKKRIAYFYERSFEFILVFS